MPTPDHPALAIRDRRCPHGVKCGPLDDYGLAPGEPGTYSAYCRICDPDHGHIDPTQEQIKLEGAKRLPLTDYYSAYLRRKKGVPTIDRRLRTSPHGDALSTRVNPYGPVSDMTEALREMVGSGRPRIFELHPWQERLLDAEGPIRVRMAPSRPPLPPWVISYIPARDFSGDPSLYWDWVAAANGMGC